MASTTQPNHPDGLTILKHLGLFIITFIMVSFTGAQFVGFHPSFFPLNLPSLSDFGRGAIFAALLLAFLGIHEFGHYFAAYFHKIRVTLPYFIPIPIGIGTLGAVIRIRQKIKHTYEMFDVGITGPLAGFIVALGVLLYGFFTLPAPSYMFHFAGHGATKQFIYLHGTFPSYPPNAGAEGGTLIIGPTLLYSFFSSFFPHVPPMWEMYHYPFLFAGWLGLFFTALNLTPVGQLDGGHILYSLIGYEKHRIVARIFFGILGTLGGIEAIPTIHGLLGQWDTGGGWLSLLIWATVLLWLLKTAFHSEPKWVLPAFIISIGVTFSYLFLYSGNRLASGSLIWVIWSFFIAFITGVEHPPTLHEKPLDTKRKILGWGSMVLYVLCISPNPIYLLQ
jgi:membrane-associated protease RseP (regulator of RpoE activity)